MQIGGQSGNKHTNAANYVNNTNALSGQSTNLQESCSNFNSLVDEFLHSEPQTQLLKDVQEQTKKTLNVFRDALEQYRLDELAMAYNGGKDCLVLLILYLVSLHKHFSNQPSKHQSFPKSLAAVYIQSAHPFEEVSSFVYSSSAHYSLSLSTSAAPMKEAFGEYLDAHPHVRAIFVGTRRADPHGAKLTHFDRTDGGWPDFMRIHPVIDWTYKEVWAFIKYLNVPYCPLYDLGYTSLGGTKDTHPNPRLKREENGRISYAPAAELIEDWDERLGRD